MNYQHHYNSLITSRLKFQEERNNLRKLRKSKKLKSNNTYFENHHITPKCLGGTDDKLNLILLTPREHYIAHWLLTKIYLNNSKLLFSLFRLSHDGQNNYVKNNSKKYQLNRILYIESISGKNSHNYGKIASKETKKKMSIRQSGNNNAMYGKEITNIHRERLIKNSARRNTPPWENSSTKLYGLQYNWFKLQEIYKIWISNDKCGGRKLLRLSLEYDNNLKPSRTFGTMILWFKKYGNPNTNINWIIFKSNFKNI